jgi:hypothetical protein
MLVDYSVQIRVAMKVEMLVFGLVQSLAVLLVAPMGQKTAAWMDRLRVWHSAEKKVEM